MNKIRKVIENNISIIDRIKFVLDFYAKGENYDNDKGFLAKSLIDDINKIYNELTEYQIENNIESEWEFEKQYRYHDIYGNNHSPEEDEIIRDIKELKKFIKNEKN